MVGNRPFHVCFLSLFCLFGYYTNHPLPFLPRYDWSLIICVLMQLWMVRSGLETRDELKVITLFHLIGLALELFKVHMGSWSYPEEGYSKMFGVPLYSGFMYASVASYLCQAWRRLNVELVKGRRFSSCTACGRDLFEFFTHHYSIDIRWWLSDLSSLSLAIMGHIRGEWNSLPYAACTFFCAHRIFIWIAENIATFFGAWTYPNQTDAWSLVHLGKVSSWLLLVIVSFLIVATLKQVKEQNPIKA
ncbi:DUF817 domain-containing protein [Bacillus inaquosorum]|nr:DUF817 domain-containing protein [Bacillus inaquosorum]